MDEHPVDEQPVDEESGAADDVVRVLLADDEALMRSGLRLILESAPDVAVVAEAADGPAAAAACRGAAVDVALLDVRMPGGGLAAAETIAATCPGTRVVMLTTFDDQDALGAALRSGAVGFLLKDTGPRELVAAVRAAHRGEQVLAPQVTRRLVERHLGEPDRRAAAAARVDVLTPAERTVLTAVAEGLSNAEVGARLYLSASTVKAHLSRVLTKLGCENRVQAAVVAHEAGIVRP